MNIVNYLKYKLNNNFDKKPDINKHQYKKENNITKSDKSIFIPSEQDSLFWCYYIITNGDVNYEMLSNKNTLIAKKLKIEYINKIRENKLIIKSYKFDTLSNIENNLANENLINIKTFMTLSIIDKINVIFVKNKTYYECLMNDSNIIYIVYEIDVNSKYNKKYGYELATDNILSKIRTTLYKLDNLNKPIKSLSSYKVDELINIANKLAIEIHNKDTGKNKSKNELYEAIIQYF